MYASVLIYTSIQSVSVRQFCSHHVRSFRQPVYIVLEYCLDVLVPIYSRPVQISTVNLSVGSSRRLPLLEVWSTLDSRQRIVDLVEKSPRLCSFQKGPDVGRPSRAGDQIRRRRPTLRKTTSGFPVLRCDLLAGGVHRSMVPLVGRDPSTSLL